MKKLSRSDKIRRNEERGGEYEGQSSHNFLSFFFIFLVAFVSDTQVGEGVEEERANRAGELSRMVL
jgi:hypothetical protein